MTYPEAAANALDDQDEKPLTNRKRTCQKIFARILPSVQTLNHLFTQILTFLLLYATLWGLFPEKAVPGGSIFAVFLLIVICCFAGKLGKLFKLPPLIGMLIAGFLYRNLPFIPYSKDIPEKWAAALRSSALVVVLLHAGLGLDSEVLKRISLLCLRLAFLPCVAEAVTAGVVSHYVFGLPWAWSFSLGFILGAVSPAIIVPSVLLLEMKGFGKNRGIATLIIASSSIDDVLAIALFGVCTGIAFSKGNLTWTLLKGPVEVLVGLVYGGIVGVFLWYFPHQKDKYKTYYRNSLLLFGGLAVTFVSQVLDFTAAGALGCLGLAFVAAVKWRKDEDENQPVERFSSDIWKIIQPFLFGLIGTEVSVSDVEKDIGYAILILVVGLLFRIITSYLSLFGSELNTKEKVFVAFAWLPKATVQAAIGSVALDLARLSNMEQQYITYGKQILTVSVLSILCTAPLGAIAIALLGPLLLHQTLVTDGTRNLEEVVDDSSKNGSHDSIGSVHVLQKGDPCAASEATM